MNSRLCRKSNKNGNLFFSAHSLIFYHLFIYFVDVNSLWNAIRTWNLPWGTVRWRKRFSCFLLVLRIPLLDTHAFAFGHFHNRFRDNTLNKKVEKKRNKNKSWQLGNILVLSILSGNKLDKLIGKCEKSVCFYRMNEE